MFKQAVFHRFWGAFLFLAVLLLASCSGRRIAATLDDVETFIQERPDSALTVLRSLDTTALATRSLRAHYALLHAMALDKNWIDTTDESVIMPAVAYYDRHRNLDRRAKAYYYLGRIQYNGHDYDKAIISLMQALVFAIGLDDNRFKSLIYQATGDTYGSTYLFEEALAYSDSSYRYCLKAGEPVLANASRFRMAQNLSNLYRYSEADSLYSLLVVDSLFIHDEHLYPRALSGYAIAIIGSDGDCEKALDLFERSLSQRGFESYNHWGAYAYCLAATGNFQKSWSIFEGLRRKGLENNYSYMGWRGRVEALAGNEREALLLLTKASEKQTERTREILRQSIFRAQRDYTEARNAMLLEKEAGQRKLWTLTILLIVVMIALAGLFLRDRIVSIRDEKQMLLSTVRMLTDKMTAMENASSSNRSGDIMDRYIQIYRSHLQNMGSIQDLLKYSGTEAGAEQLVRKLKGMVKGLNADKKRYYSFEAMMDQEFDQVMNHYREVYPGQNEDQYRLVCYLFAGFDVVTICALIGNRSKQAIYSKKSKLKQKIARSECKYREQFLKMLD